MASEYVQERFRESGWLRTAHRGAPRYATDNTAESIEIAASFAIDLVEIDVHLSKDGHLMLWHDEEIAVDGLEYKVREHTLNQLKALPIKGTLATLEEAIELVRGKAGLMVDLKAPDLEQPLSQCFKQMNFFDLCVCGGYKSTLEFFRQQLPQVSTSLTPNLFEVIDFSRWDAVTVYWRMVSAELLQSAHQHGKWVLAWTVDDLATAQQLLQMGVKGITSNDVDMLCSIEQRAQS